MSQEIFGMPKKYLTKKRFVGAFYSERSFFSIVSVQFQAGSSSVPSWEVFARAALEALKDAEIDFSKIQALHLGNVYSSFTEKQTNIAPLTLSTIGKNVHIPSIRYESACASGGVAFRQGYLSILSGLTTWFSSEGLKD